MNTRTTLATLLFLSLAASTLAADKLVERKIDRRNATERDADYFVIFCARRSPDKEKPGHAFVVWAESNRRRGYSAAKAFGLYPAKDVKGKKVVLGSVPGMLANEAFTASKDVKLLTHRLIVQVNRDVWLKSQDRIKKYRTSDFNLYSKNCVVFAWDVAGSLGVIARMPEKLETPQAYFTMLITQAKAK